MENLEQKKRRIFGKKYLSNYLEELNKLFKIDISQDDLLSIVDTDEFINNTAIALKNRVPTYTETILFTDKIKLKEILNKKVSKANVPYNIFLSYSLDCGLARIPNLSFFNLDFSFFDEHSGIIIFIRYDGHEKILLDYYEESNKKLLNIEIYKV